MAGPRKALADDDARRIAIAVHDRSFLVEAGAGSGKTAIMAGRIAVMLADGVAPKSITAVTFTELAASELLLRVYELVEKLTAGDVPAELRAALPNGLSERQQGHLADAKDALDEMTCSTIHGFCQRLIMPYPVEADIDPGAAVMDPDQADLVFREIVDAWLRETLTVVDAGGLLEELVVSDSDRTIELIYEILDHLRRYREVVRDPLDIDLTPLFEAFKRAANDFTSFVNDAPAQEDDTSGIASCFAELANELVFDPTIDNPRDLVVLLLKQPGPELCTSSGDFRRYQKKTKWGVVTQRVGLSKADGDRLNAKADARYKRCCETWIELRQAVAARVLNGIIRLVEPVMERFQSHKRSAALLDFDDLLFAARNLLRDYEDVRRALAERFAHVLVDEFQDTDPIQTEIFWRLCGESQDAAADTDWRAFRIRPGALFLVGDPKQAIYRFRGADVATYVRARDAFQEQGADSVLKVSTNFRSCPSILRFVNERFEGLLAVENRQPGFTALDPFQPERSEGPSVASLEVTVANEEGEPTVEEQRDGEAEAVAKMCARLIGSEVILDHKTGEHRPCRAGDIALLTPTKTDLWRYEEALERHGIPVATQAGKGLFRRQEIQDLIAVTRVLADRRDTLAFGALLRGPLVGLTEEELLDIVVALPRNEEALDVLPRLDVGVASDDVAHPLARDIIEKLQSLRRRANTTTPHDLLSQAVDVLRVRPILLQRHEGQAERALANVDLYLGYSRAYAVRGLRAFAEAMTAAWTDESHAVEGRPDAQEESVALYTMHAAKGLEWPIVVPVNTMSRPKAPKKAVVDRDTKRLYFPVFGVAPAGHEAVFKNEKAELGLERVRLWYVAATRARELLILPRLDVSLSSSAWATFVDLSLTELSALDLEHYPLEFTDSVARIENTQTRERFVLEAATITERQRSIVWLAPSRGEDTGAPAPEVQIPQILEADTDGTAEEAGETYTIQGGRERGVILHKLIEEVFTGETQETLPALVARAEHLIRVLGHPIVADPAHGLAPAELASCVIRALSIPEIVDLRPRLVPEVPVYSAVAAGTEERVTTGVADAVAFGSDGAPEVVIDWKSDVAPTPETLKHYCAQVRAYLDATKAERGLVVVMTDGAVVSVARMTPEIDADGTWANGEAN